MSIIIGIDPGPTQSGMVVYAPELREHPVTAMLVENRQLAALLATKPTPRTAKRILAIEWVQCYGPAINAGADVFHTCRWVGRFEEAWGADAMLLTRPQIKAHLCGNVRAKDKHVRQALLDRFGGDEKAIGGKRCLTCHGKGWTGRGRAVCSCCAGTGYRVPPGPLAGVKSHEWSALAVAVVAADELEKRGDSRD